MVDVRGLAAAVLGVGLGIVFIAFPRAIVRFQTVGRIPHDRGGDYGSATAVPTRWVRLVQGIGVVILLVGLYIGATLTVL